MASVLSEAYFHDEAAATVALEAILWPNGPVCPHCGETGRINKLVGVKRKDGTVRLGLWKCYDCRGQFTVRKGTIFEDSHVPLHLWFQAAYLMCASKKGVSSNQLHRTLGVTLKTAWFMSHRLRESMRELNPEGPLGGEGRTVEFDETYVGGKEKNKHAHKRHGVGGGYGKEVVLSLVERGGRVRSHHVPTVTGETLRPILKEQIHEASAVYTDDGGSRVGREFAGHQSVNHSIKEYVRGPVHTNTIEGYFSIMKRGIVGVYHHVSPQHLKRYLAEFDFRYNNRVGLGVGDRNRTVTAIKGASGKRLMYRDSLGR
ncbi:MAG: IS1595 family transposase [Bauldia sp.]|nr:IS1595 family transposase [Bauldia sp.]